jgi:hypothetical protein
MLVEFAEGSCGTVTKITKSSFLKSEVNLPATAISLNERLI